LPLTLLAWHQEEYLTCKNIYLSFQQFGVFLETHLGKPSVTVGDCGGTE